MCVQQCKQLVNVNKVWFMDLRLNSTQETHSFPFAKPLNKSIDINEFYIKFTNLKPLVRL